MSQNTVRHVGGSWIFWSLQPAIAADTADTKMHFKKEEKIFANKYGEADFVHFAV